MQNQKVKPGGDANVSLLKNSAKYDFACVTLKQNMISSSQ